MSDQLPYPLTEQQQAHEPTNSSSQNPQRETPHGRVPAERDRERPAPYTLSIPTSSPSLRRSPRHQQEPSSPSPQTDPNPIEPNRNRDRPTLSRKAKGKQKEKTTSKKTRDIIRSIARRDKMESRNSFELLDPDISVTATDPPPDEDEAMPAAGPSGVPHSPPPENAVQQTQASSEDDPFAAPAQVLVNNNTINGTSPAAGAASATQIGSVATPAETEGEGSPMETSPAHATSSTNATVEVTAQQAPATPLSRRDAHEMARAQSTAIAQQISAAIAAEQARASRIRDGDQGERNSEPATTIPPSPPPAYAPPARASVRDGSPAYAPVPPVPTLMDDVHPPHPAPAETHAPVAAPIPALPAPVPIDVEAQPAPPVVPVMPQPVLAVPDAGPEVAQAPIPAVAPLHHQADPLQVQAAAGPPIPVPAAHANPAPAPAGPAHGAQPNIAPALAGAGGQATEIPETKAGEFGGVADRVSGHTTLDSGLVLTSTPLPHGFPIPNTDVPTTYAQDPEQVQFWWSLPGYKVLVRTTEAQYLTYAQGLVNTMNNTFSALVPGAWFRIHVPVPADPHATATQGPVHYLVQFSDENVARAFLAQRIISTSAITLITLPLQDRLYPFLLALWLFVLPPDSDGTAEVADTVRNCLNQDNSVAELIRQNTPNATAYTYPNFIQSISASLTWVILHRGQPKVPCWLIYCQPPPTSHEKWQAIRRKCATVTYKHNSLGTGKVRDGKDLFFCRMCMAVDHGSGLCKLPLLHGWLGPPPLNSDDPNPGQPSIAPAGPPPPPSHTTQNFGHRGRGRGGSRGNGGGRGGRGGRGRGRGRGRGSHMFYS